MAAISASFNLGPPCGIWPDCTIWKRWLSSGLPGTITGCPWVALLACNESYVDRLRPASVLAGPWQLMHLGWKTPVCREANVGWTASIPTVPGAPGAWVRGESPSPESPDEPQAAAETIPINRTALRPGLNLDRSIAVGPRFRSESQCKPHAASPPPSLPAQPTRTIAASPPRQAFFCALAVVSIITRSMRARSSSEISQTCF